MLLIRSVISINDGGFDLCRTLQGRKKRAGRNVDYIWHVFDKSEPPVGDDTISGCVVHSSSTRSSITGYCSSSTMTEYNRGAFAIGHN